MKGVSTCAIQELCLGPKKSHDWTTGFSLAFPSILNVQKWLCVNKASLVAQLVEESACNADLGSTDPLEKGTAIYSSILAWRISWTV